MEDNNEVESGLSARPSAAQVTAVVDFMLQHPDLANAKLRNNISKDKAKKLWDELTAMANSIPGTTKSTQGWMRFWIDKKGMVRNKKKLVDIGKHSSILTPAEEKIWNLCLKEKEGNGSAAAVKRKKSVKKEIVDEDDVPLRSQFTFDEPPIPDTEERQMSVMEELVQVMDRQAVAMSQLAQASATNAQALNKLAEASLTQARAVESLASTFVNIGSAVHDVRNAIINIDYTMKRCYNINQT